MHKYSSFLLHLTFCSLFACAGGCVAVAALMDKTGGDPKEPAKFVPEHENTLVLVENYKNPALVEMLADHMDQLIGEELVVNKVAPIINSEKLTLLRLDHPDQYRKMKIPTIGLELGARQVLYANITDFAVTSEGGTEIMRGHAEARVKIVDCVTGETRWPNDATTAGYAVTVDLPFSRISQDVNIAAVHDMLAKALSAKIARLFYNATIDQPDPTPKYPESNL